MGDISDKPDAASFETVGEGILVLSIATAEIEGGVGIKLARDFFVAAD